MMRQQKLLLDDDNLNSASDDLHANTVVDSCFESKGQENGSNHQHYSYSSAHPPPTQNQPLIKKKRSLPGNPDPEAEVISLSPKTLMATNRFVCEICNKGFQRDQNLQLHRRGHNLPWKLKQRNKDEVVRKKMYVCPEVNCIHHEPSRALGDLTGIKKHFCRKHGEKKWKCDKCSKTYAVQSDWKAHSKTCGTREYKCDCGTLFSRRDSFMTHRAFCDALAEETARAITGIDPTTIPGQNPTRFTDHHVHIPLLDPIHTSFLKKENNHPFPSWLQITQSQDQDNISCSPNGPTLISYHPTPTPAAAYMSATALLQKAAQMGTTHLSRGTSLQAPCTSTTSLRPHNQQQYIPHVSVNSPAAAAGNNTCGTSGSSGPSPPPPSTHHPSSSFVQPMNMNNMSMSMMMMMMNEDSFSDVSTFEDAFGQILDAKKEDDDVHEHGRNMHDKSTHMMMHDSKSGNIMGVGVKGGEGMTRDFLGLKAPSHINGSDIVSMNQSLKLWHAK